MFGLAAAEVFDDFLKAVVMFLGVFVADSPNFFDDFIAVHGHSPAIAVPGECKFQGTENENDKGWGWIPVNKAIIFPIQERGNRGEKRAGIE
jgi:hypothetical protein